MLIVFLNFVFLQFYNTDSIPWLQSATTQLFTPYRKNIVYTTSIRYVRKGRDFEGVIL